MNQENNFRNLMKLALKGNLQAQFEVGLLIAAEVNLYVGKAWLMQAAFAGHHGAILALLDIEQQADISVA